MRRGPCLTTIGAVAAALVLPCASAHGRADTQPVGFTPLSSAGAATLVNRSGFEPRAANYVPNHTVPGKRALRAWRKRSKAPYRRFVDGNFTGTTDEIIQWAAYKWGFDEDILRADAAVESWWRQSTVGGHGSSFGLFQVRAPFHCPGKCKIARRSTAFNADAYGAVIRAYFDGKQAWLNTVPHGRPYSAGDLWGSLGAWFAGRWWTGPAANYIAQVQYRLNERTWTQPYFLGR
jgi:hypothetical protein